MWCEVRVQIHSFVYGYPVVPAPFVEKTVLSPLNSLGTLVENQLSTDRWVYLFLFLFEVELIYNIVLISGVQQSDSVVYIFQIIFHYRLL